MAIAALLPMADASVPIGNDEVFMSIEDGDSGEVEMEEKMEVVDGEVQTGAVLLKKSSEESHPVSTAVGAPESTYVVFRVERVPVRTPFYDDRSYWSTYDIDGTLYANFGSSSQNAREATTGAVSESRPKLGPDIAKLIVGFVPHHIMSATMRFTKGPIITLAQVTPSGEPADATSAQDLTAAVGLPGNTSRQGVDKHFTVVWARYPTETSPETSPEETRGTGRPAGVLIADDMQRQPLTPELQRLGLAQLAHPKGKKNAEMMEMGVPWKSSNNVLEMMRVLPSLKVSDLIVWQIPRENEGTIAAWFDNHKDLLQN